MIAQVVIYQQPLKELERNKRLKFNCLIFVSFQIQKKQRKKSKNLFEDDALLFGEEEQSPSVDIFGSPPKVNIVNLFLIEELPPLCFPLYCYTGSLTRLNIHISRQVGFKAIFLFEIEDKL